MFTTRRVNLQSDASIFDPSTSNPGHNQQDLALQLQIASCTKRLNRQLIKHLNRQITAVIARLRMLIALGVHDKTYSLQHGFCQAKQQELCTCAVCNQGFFVPGHHGNEAVFCIV